MADAREEQNECRLQTLKVSDLRAKLQSFGLPHSGRKQVVEPSAACTKSEATHKTIASYMYPAKLLNGTPFYHRYHDSTDLHARIILFLHTKFVIYIF